MEAIKALKELKLDHYRIKYTNIPDVELLSIVRGSKYQDKTAGGLTSCICDFVNFQGGKASRVNTTGTYSKAQGRFIKSGSTKGASDIDIVYWGRAIKVEVKIGRDTLGPKQIQWQQDIEKAGGIYYVARDFESFYQWWNTKIKRG